MIARRLALPILLSILLHVAPAVAQTAVPETASRPGHSADSVRSLRDDARAPDGSQWNLPRPEGWTAKPVVPGLADPFRRIGDDLTRFLSADTFRVVALGGAVALAAHPWDDEAAAGAQLRLQPARRFSAGNTGGSFLVQTGAAFATLAVGQVTDSPRVAQLGSDLVRAQLVSQAVVQGVKFATGRTRPDGSNHFSFPSGHTASATATATVLQRHFGWKAGAPAYLFAGYVASSRLSANKHHLSDVLMGAAIGIAAGRTVTWGIGREKFDIGVAPTVGGAAITFTRRPSTRR